MQSLLLTVSVITIKINANVDINKAIRNYARLRSERYSFSGLNDEVHCLHLGTGAGKGRV